LEDLGVDGRMMLDNIKWILKKWVGRYGLDWSGPEWGQVAGCCECCKEPSCSIKCGECLH